MRNKRLYNYIVNTLELSKEVILKHVEERLEDIVAKHVRSKLDSKEMERIILDRVTDIVANGIQDSYAWHRKYNFDSYLQGIVQRIMEEKLNKDYRLDVRMIEKEKKTIARARRTK